SFHDFYVFKFVIQFFLFFNLQASKLSCCVNVKAKRVPQKCKLLELRVLENHRVRASVPYRDSRPGWGQIDCEFYIDF
ncbi:MAG: hypothetical protein JXR31_01950, partial [Prolixibacteraceae bacterium]|nr:hypothetical protein [Prolixibacteraceae bacterium]